MYFSLITPRPGQERSAAHEWLGSAYGEHQWLWHFFPAPDGTERDFLFRRRDSGDLPRFYVVSKRPPQSGGTTWQVQTREYAPKVEAGMRLTFDLRANPVIAHSIDGKGSRHDVVMHEKKRLLQARGLPNWEAWSADRTTADGAPDPRPPLYELVHRTCTEWLKGKAERCGFTLEESRLDIAAYQQHGGKKGQLRFSTVDFSGELAVSDPDQFTTALRSGVGRAKAFGCGLLLIRHTK